MTDRSIPNDRPTLRDLPFDEIHHMADLRLAVAHRFGEMLAVMNLAVQLLDEGDVEYATRVMKYGLKTYDTPDVTIDAATKARNVFRGPRANVAHRPRG